MRNLLTEAGIRLVGEAGDASTALDVAIETGARVLLLERGIPFADVLEALSGAREREPRLRTLAVGDYPPQDQRAVLLAGASGVLPTEEDPRRVTMAVRIVAAGEALVPAEVTPSLVNLLRAGTQSRRGLRPLLGPLSSREWEVVEELRSGASTAEAARRLGVAPATINSHVRNISRKLGASNRKELLVAAERLRAGIPMDAG